MIKLKSGTYSIRHWDYFWNGSCLHTVVTKKGNSFGKILEIVPKKYYQDILFKEHEAIKCGVTSTIPNKIKFTGEKPYILIKMKRGEK